jgi:tetratricopeptide (TPR) repeat protein
MGDVIAWVAAALVVIASGCVGPGGGRVETVTPIRVSDAVGLGDPARRASTRLVVQGLEADAAHAYERARGSYERAIQVDATNPYAYLALARHYVDLEAADPRDAERSLLLIDQAAALFEAEDMREPRVGVHLMGLRGRAMRTTGQEEDAALYLDRARALSPAIWGDEYLSAEELL